jgi:simple sugar transport system permease protein
MSTAPMTPPAGRADTGGERRRQPVAGILQSVIPLLAAAVAGAVALAATGWNPASVYELMAREAFGSAEGIQSTIGAATPLLFTGLATAIAFRSGAFNVGLEGSFVLGGLAGAAIGAALDVPGVLLIPVCLVAGAVVGGAWATPPALLRVRLGVDEVVTTLMLNFVAAALASWVVNAFLLAPGSANSASRPILSQAELPTFGSEGTVTLGVVIALLAVVGYAAWTRSGVGGFELRLTGISTPFARAVGIDVRRVVTRAMVVSGAVAGLGGAAHALGVIHRFSDGFSPGYGFTGIAIALLARGNPVGVVLGAVLFGALASAGATAQLFSDIPLDLVDVLQGTVMVAATVQVLRLRPRTRGRAA